VITGRDGSKHTGLEEKAAVTRDFGHSGSQKLTRRGFAALSAVMALSLLRSPLIACRKATAQMLRDIDTKDHGITLFLCGDVMTGRGIDQVLAYPSDPRICEPFVSSALEYVDLAEHANGPIPRPVDFSYIWGDALDELERVGPDARIINLETSVTRNDDCEPKGVNYRMNPKNIPCLSAARIDCCVLANNHLLDWRRAGLLETLETLEKAGIATAGAGRHRQEAEAPAIIEVAGKARVIVFSFGSETSGIPRDWAAGDDTPGVNLLGEVSDRTLGHIAAQVRQLKRPGDVVIASIHWGANWGYEVPRDQSELAHRLIDEAGVDVVHGHSSHHPKGIEVYKDKLILYGCGEFIDDYEGISGYEAYRDDLVLMYFPRIDVSSGKLSRLTMTPLQIKRFRLNRASRDDARWLCNVLNREGETFGTQVFLNENNRLTLRWK
jgi:poly-gamma-glutamate synthesis protein (capsule biosynthesis protein)